MLRRSDQVVYTGGLTKEFAPGVGAVDVDLDVRRGEVYGFLGPNGAGKSTTLDMLSGISRSDRGVARVLGQDPWYSHADLMRRVGVLHAEMAFAKHHTGRSLVGLVGRLRSQPTFGPHAEILAERFELDLERRAADLSLGNRQKLGLVLAAAHEPELLILDEPTSGLDPLMQLQVDGYFRELASTGVSVLLSSHSLAQIERTADRVGFIRDSRLVAQGPLSMLRSRKMQQAVVIFPQPVSPELFDPVDSTQSPDSVDVTRVHRVDQMNPVTLKVTWSGPAAPVLRRLGALSAQTINTHNDLELSVLDLYDAAPPAPDERLPE